MNWSKSKLGELAFFQRGFDITKKEQEDGEYPVVSSSGTQSFHSKATVKGPGVVIGRKGTLGSVFYIERDFWAHDTTLWVKDFQGNNPKFVYYFLKTLELGKFDSGGANPTLNRNHIHGIEILKPPVLEQERIAETLSNYDRLIDNNTRRIALLEESIHRIYQEWFVYLRYPGFITCIPNESIPLYLLYCWLKENVGNFSNLATGATFKEISKGVFKKIEIIVPSEVTSGEFESKVKPIGDCILNLQRQNQKLREARDLLLPRLMNGSLSV